MWDQTGALQRALDKFLTRRLNIYGCFWGLERGSINLYSKFEPDGLNISQNSKNR